MQSPKETGALTCTVSGTTRTTPSQLDKQLDNIMCDQQQLNCQGNFQVAGGDARTGADICMQKFYIAQLQSGAIVLPLRMLQ